MAMAAMLVGAGCRLVPSERDFREMESTTTATISGVDKLPRYSPGEGPSARAVAAMLEEDLTAGTAVRVALANNRRIQAKYARLDVAAAERLAARLLKNPQAEGSVIMLELEGNSNKNVVELGVEVDVLHMILLPKRSRMGEARFGAAKLDVARAVQKPAYDTRVAYYRLLAAHHRLAMLESFMEGADAGRDMAQRLRDAGNITELDRLNREALYEQAALGVAAGKLRVAEARENLNVLMGLSGPHTSWRVAGELPQPSDSRQPTDMIVAQALENSVQLGVTKWRVAAAAEALGIARIESVLPALHLGVQAEREPERVWLVGPMVSVELPLFNFGQASRPAAAAALRRLRHEYAALAIEIGAAGRRAVKRAETAAERAERYRLTLLPLQA